MNNPTVTQNDLRLLVLAPNWLGDVVMHTPLLSGLDAVREKVRARTGRQLRLTLGVRKEWVGLFADDQRVDDLLALERGGKYGGAKGVFRLASRLKREVFEAAIICPPSFRTGLVARLAKIPVRVGYKSDGRSLLLTTGLASLPRGQEHYSREMMALGEAWSAASGLGDLALPGQFPSASLPGCRPVLAAVHSSRSPFWVVAPGTTYGEAKSWPLDRVAEFVTAAKSTADVRIVFLGDKAARGFTGQLRNHFPSGWGNSLATDADLVDLTGRTNLVEAVSVLKAAAAFVGNDSGLMHLAAALGVPTVGVFGSSNPDWTAPLGPAAVAVTAAGFACRPCYLKNCNQAEFCLDTVQAETVLAAVLEVAGKTGFPEEDS